MKITKVCCQGCGADLQVDETIRFATCNYCHARLEIVHDPTVTHTRLLEEIALNTGRSADRLHVLELQNDLERLEREWENEQARHLIFTGEGRRKALPTEFDNYALGAIMGAVGIVALPLSFFFHRRMGTHVGGGPYCFLALFALLLTKAGDGLQEGRSGI